MLLKGLYHNFYLRIAVFILLTIAGTYLVLQQEWVWVVPILSVWSFFLRLVLLSDKRNAQKVAFKFDAIDNSDYAFRYATRGRSSNDKLVSESLNRITQILSNFINNAIKFTEFGYIHVGYTLSEKYIRFHVQDSGIGISTKNQEQIFDRFIKLNTFARGTGLGLSICKSIVEKLGGEIGVKSTLGCGSTFWFSLPYDPLYKAKSGASDHR